MLPLEGNDNDSDGVPDTADRFRCVWNFLCVAPGTHFMNRWPIAAFTCSMTAVNSATTSGDSA